MRLTCSLATGNASLLALPALGGLQCSSVGIAALFGARTGLQSLTVGAAAYRPLTLNVGAACGAFNAGILTIRP
ncbi:hypothetical protein EHV15_12355 [Paenibacillus oralis]|uniref:Uncharacterized protein n=1 Tax=Paenibacillus oralis TaxID=2490856 RepID=A0A3P3U4X6_9BACL|nr:hypothetical protein [Paenibacillus oralis]RRJ63633.1 hypothetical protein EHV15_12355 [Paenibacillus oralis]